MNPQYKKGVLELCVLSLLRKQDRYGYEISDYLSRHIDITDGTVYPLLRKMKADGLVTTYLQEESGGPPRKYYKLADGYFEEEIAARLCDPAMLAAAALAYVVCALSTGSFQFWHVWGWFRYRG